MGHDAPPVAIYSRKRVLGPHALATAAESDTGNHSRTGPVAPPQPRLIQELASITTQYNRRRDQTERPTSDVLEGRFDFYLR